VFSPNNRMIYG